MQKDRKLQIGKIVTNSIKMTTKMVINIGSRAIYFRLHQPQHTADTEFSSKAS